MITVKVQSFVLSAALLFALAASAEAGPRPPTRSDLGQPVPVGVERTASGDRLPVAGPLKTTARPPRRTWRTSVDKQRPTAMVDVDLSAQLKGGGTTSRPLHHLSPGLMQQVRDLTNPLFLRAHLASADKSDLPAPRAANKDLPWTADQKLANPTNMNDEYVSLAEYPATGNLYAVFAAKDLGGTDRDIHIARSTDRGQTWQVWEMPSFSEDEYHPEIAIDGGGYLHVTWVRADGYILRTRTTNPDAPTQWAWVKGLAVGEPCATPSIAVSGAGDFAKVFIAAGWLTINYDYYQYEWTMIFMSSSNGGNSVSYDYFLPDGYADYWPDVAMSGGTVHFINAEVDAYSGETEILIATDLYNGSFSDPASLTGWTQNNTGFPQLACAGSDVFVVYQLDWTDGVSSDGDIVYSYSWDAGNSWFGPYGLVADEYDSVGPTVFTRNGIVGCLWLDAPAGADEYQLGSRLASGYGDISYFGDVQIVTEQPRVEPVFHSAAGVATVDRIHAAWIDRRDYATEGHNVYTSRQVLEPNLRPFVPADWDTSLLANMIRGERGDGWLAAGDTAYVSFAFLNDGLRDAGNSFFVDLEIDGAIAASWVLDSGLATGTYVPLTDYPVVLPAGSHTIRLVLDPTDAVAESDESDNVVTRTLDWIDGDPELRLRPTRLVTIINPALKRVQALDMVTRPPLRREVHLPVVAANLEAALGQAKSGEMLRVMIVPAERLDTVALGAALKDAGGATRREVVLASARHQIETSQALLAADLSGLVKAGLAAEPVPLWLPGMIAMQMSPAAVTKLALNPDVGLLWLDEVQSEAFAGNPVAATGQAAAAGDKSVAWHLAAIGADQAWAAGHDGSGVLVGHLDTGVAYDHPDLRNHLWDGGAAFPHHGWDAVSDDNDPYDGDTSWHHGTHTAGLIVGDGTSGTTTGVAPGAQLMVLRSVPGTFVDMVEAMQFGLDHGVQIFSMSAGWTLPPDEVRVANRYNAELLYSVDIPWICAAGNGDNRGGHHPVPNDIASPGDCPGPWYAPSGGQTAVFTVGAVDNVRQVGPTSSHGPTVWNTTNPNGTTPYNDYPYTPGLMKPDIAAPGVAITSTTAPDGYVTYDGTSMACPLVTGSFCLVMAAVPGLNPAQLAEIFETTAVDVTAPPAGPGRDAYSGAGLVDLPAALDRKPPTRPLQVKITNCGNLPLIFGETFSSAGWLQIEAPAGFVAPGATRLLNVVIDPAALAEGVHQASVVFLSNHPGGPVLLPVTLLYGDYATGVDDQVPASREGGLENYPNPFNPRTVLRFETRLAGPVALAIHDLRGRLVRRLVQADLPVGAHEYVWDGRDQSGGAAASGQYFARLVAPGLDPVTRKLMLVR